MFLRTMSIIGLLAALALGGCATYVNIPAQRGDLASHNPDDWTVREVTAAALTYLLTDPESSGTKVGGQYAIVLPKNSKNSTYKWVTRNIPAGGDRISDEAGRIPVYRIAQVQVRGLSGQVDIVQPGPGDEEQLVSVYMKRDIDGWYGERDRLWRIPVGLALRAARPPLPPDTGAFSIQEPAPEASKPAPEPTPVAADDDMAEDAPAP